MPSNKRRLRLLGIDFGTKRIGFAVSDEMGWGARPLEVYSRKDIARDLEHVKALARQYEVKRIVVGVPFKLDGSTGASAKRALAFIEALDGLVEGVPVTTRDEALTTFAANQRLDEEGIRDPKKRREKLDAYAAAVILQEELDAVD